MSIPRTFRFGVQHRRADSGQEWGAICRRTESLGYDALCMTDHFLEQFAAIPAMMAAAAATTHMKVGTTVFCNDFHHPAILAREFATLDLLSNGRTFIGLGAGWFVDDYTQMGIPMLSPTERIGRLEEGVRIIKASFLGEPFSERGAYYQVTNLVGRPLPAQRPRPPIYIGGGGKRLLRLAGREADIVGINPSLPRGDRAEFDHKLHLDGPPDEKIAWVKEAAGDRFDDVELSIIAFLLNVTDDRDALARQMAAQYQTTPEIVLSSPYAIMGTVDQIVDTLLRRREQYGISFITIQPNWMEAFAPVVERLAGR